MANFYPQKMNFDEINGGNQYTDADGLQSKTINDVVQSTMYSQMLATNQPNIDEIDGEGEPSITIEEVGGSPRLKFTNFGNRQKVEILSKKVENLESRLNDEDFSVVEANAYEQQVPTNALPFAEVTKVGGMTHKVFGENLLNSFSLSDFVDGNDDGLTFTNNGDGSFTVNGTSTMQSLLKLNTVSLEIGKSYVLSGSAVAPSLYENQPAFGLTDGEMIDGGYGNSFVAKSSTADIYFFVYEGGITFSDVVIRPNIRTVELKNAKVTEIKSFGRNLFDLVAMRNSSAGTTINGDSLTVNFADGQVYVNRDKRVHFPAGTYTFQTWGNAGYVLYCYPVSNLYGSASVVKYSSSAVDHQSFTFTMTEAFALCMGGYSGQNGTFTFKAQFERGSVATDFVSYKEYPPLPIPQAVQDLDGWGVGYDATNYNHIVWQPESGIKKFVQNCYRATLNGTEYAQFESIGSGAANYANTYIVGVNIASNYKASVSLNGFADIYDNIQASELGTKKGIMTGFWTEYFYITDPDFTDLATAKAKLAANPVNICFYSNTTQETDISHILSDDNFIEVEAGGVITPENENQLSAPLQVVYQVK